MIQCLGAGVDPCGSEFAFVVLEKCDMDGWTFVNQHFQPEFKVKGELNPSILLAWADLAEGC